MFDLSVGEMLLFQGKRAQFFLQRIAALMTCNHAVSEEMKTFRQCINKTGASLQLPADNARKLGNFLGHIGT